MLCNIIIVFFIHVWGRAVTPTTRVRRWRIAEWSGDRYDPRWSSAAVSEWVSANRLRENCLCICVPVYNTPLTPILSVPRTRLSTYTATELVQSPRYTELEQSFAAYHICSVSSLKTYFFEHCYPRRAREVTLSFMNTSIALTNLLTGNIYVRSVSVNFVKAWTLTSPRHIRYATQQQQQ